MELEGRLLGGRYRIRNLLGSGGMGAVYAAEQEDLRKQVAVKVLLHQTGISAAGLARFKREALAVAKLGHPNIVQVTDFQAWPDEPALLVMELLRGESLHALLAREKRVRPERAIFIITQVLAALAAAHAAGIIHRDIKPANIFLTKTPAMSDLVKVLDFGSARAPGLTDGPISEANTVIGTPAYMAPEQAQAGVGDHRADLYSVGVCLFEMLVGRRPHEAKTLGAVLAAHAENRPSAIRASAPEIAPKLADAVDSALNRDPRHRPQRALDMLDMLRGDLGGDLPTQSSNGPGRQLSTDTASLTLDSSSDDVDARAPAEEVVPMTARMASPHGPNGPTLVVAPSRMNAIASAPKTLLLPRAPSPRAPTPTTSTSGELARAATWSLLVSIVGLLLFLLPVGFVGMALGLRARSIAARLRLPLPPSATWGIVLGLLGSVGFVGSCGMHVLGRNVIGRKQAARDARILVIEQGLGDKASARDLDRDTACGLSELFFLRGGFQRTKGYEIATVECPGVMSSSSAGRSALGDVYVGTPDGRIEVNVCFKRGQRWLVTEAHKEPCSTTDGGP